MTLFDKLRDQAAFTDTDQAIANYVLACPEDAANLNIGELAKATHTSNAAVTRFSHRLGLGGYRALRIELARELERASTHVFDVNPDQPFIEETTTEEMMESVLNLSRRALEDTHRSLSTEEVSKAAQLITDAKRVAIFAIGDTWVATEGFSNLLMKVGIPCIEGILNSDNIVVGNILGVSDVALFVTYSGVLFSYLEAAVQGLRGRGCKAIVVSALENPEGFVPGVECVLRLPKGETRKGRIATYYSQACVRYALNCVYGEVFRCNWHDSMAVQARYAERESWE